MQARTNAGGGPEDEPLDRTESNGPSSNSRAELYNKLRAVEVEIDAVAHTVEQVKNFARDEDHISDDDDSKEQGDVKEKHSASPNDFTLQEALVADRLRSLKKTKAQLEKELKNASKDKSSEGNKHDKLLQNLVKEERKHKRKLKEIPKSSNNSKKKHKTVSFDEDDDFDSVLNAASAGFVETVS